MIKTKMVIFWVVALLLIPGIQAQNIPNKSPWDWLQELVLIPGVSGKEGKVADTIQKALPPGFEVKRDDSHNLWFTKGAGKPHIVFVAHTDEIGFLVDKITPSGRLTVKGRGGFFPKMYEGHAVHIYTSRGRIEGVVVPRPKGKEDNISPYQMSDVEIYLGVSSGEEALELGVAEGDSVTIKKKLIFLRPDLLCTRAVDDRAGCAVLLAAAWRIEWDKVEGKTVSFVWDVQEEIGLIGASRMAPHLQGDIVFPVDTFVSSDSPLDDKRFAYLPLGAGAVIRAIDSSNITPYPFIHRVRLIAEKSAIPVQLGNTRGGNDGSVFVPEGAVDIPLSWPGTYSHSFIEKIHKQDLEALTDLVIALVRDW
ncbi:MAG: hypothetical protein JXB26_02000 [Candidatus Aminicenantes bacterium]|nr:hypothetical protein [Candidatus Aminicenantes bacterium]